jgi:dienelactone hydrolase
VLALHGHDDPMVAMDTAVAFGKEMTGAGVDWQLHVFGRTKHAFTNPHASDHGRGTVYNEDANRRSWSMISNFLEEVLK